MEERYNSGYRIISSFPVSDNADGLFSVVMGHNEKSGQYVTWRYNQNNDMYDYGHYFDNPLDAQIDFLARARHELGWRSETLNKIFDNIHDFYSERSEYFTDVDVSYSKVPLYSTDTLNYRGGQFHLDVSANLVKHTVDYDLEHGWLIHYEHYDSAMDMWDKFFSTSNFTKTGMDEKARSCLDNDQEKTVRENVVKFNPAWDKLPEVSYIYLPTTQEIGLVEKGKMGYRLSTLNHAYDEVGQEFVDKLNANINVTKAQAAAMEAGSMFGWHIPAADPDYYNEDGEPNRDKISRGVAEYQKAHSETNTERGSENER